MENGSRETESFHFVKIHGKHTIVSNKSLEIRVLFVIKCYRSCKRLFIPLIYSFCSGNKFYPRQNFCRCARLIIPVPFFVIESIALFVAFFHNSDSAIALVPSETIFLLVNLGSPKLIIEPFHNNRIVFVFVDSSIGMIHLIEPKILRFLIEFKILVSPIFSIIDTRKDRICSFES